MLTEEQREAKRAYEREWRRTKYANDPEYKARKKETDARWRQAVKDRMDEYKLTNGCRDCGYRKCAAALSFHHLDPQTKEFEVANKMYNLSQERLEIEMAKCVLLCMNCHIERHHNTFS